MIPPLVDHSHGRSSARPNIFSGGGGGGVGGGAGAAGAGSDQVRPSTNTFSWMYMSLACAAHGGGRGRCLLPDDVMIRYQAVRAAIGGELFDAAVQACAEHSRVRAVFNRRPSWTTTSYLSAEAQDEAFGHVANLPVMQEVYLWATALRRDGHPVTLPQAPSTNIFSGAADTPQNRHTTTRIHVHDADSSSRPMLTR